MNEFKQVATIDFRVVGGTLDEAYDIMKNYQLLGQAGDDANIIYKGVSIPAGGCESIEEVRKLYEVLKSEDKSDKIERDIKGTSVEVDFYTEEDNLEEVFECMQQYKEHGYADKHSNIVYHDVVIPAGYCATYADVEAMYHSIIFDDWNSFVASISADLLSIEVFSQYEAERKRITQMEEVPPIVSYPAAMTYQKVAVQSRQLCGRIVPDSDKNSITKK